MTTQLGLFKLIDPPDGQVEMLRDTLTLIDYPWHRLLPVLHRDPDQSVVVRWIKAQHHGLYIGNTIEIHLSTQYTTWEQGVPFTFAHEIGHLVDYVTFGVEEQQALLDLMHEEDESRYAGQEDPNNPGHPHPWSHDRPHEERWPSVQKDYLFRPREAYADLFVATFAPALWSSKSPRFVHWTNNFDAVREITLRRTIMAFKDIQDNTHKDAIEWAAGQGLIKGYDDGTFRPNEPITRGQLASILKRYEEQR